MNTRHSVTVNKTTTSTARNQSKTPPQTVAREPFISPMASLAGLDYQTEMGLHQTMGRNVEIGLRAGFGQRLEEIVAVAFIEENRPAQMARDVQCARTRPGSIVLRYTGSNFFRESRCRSSGWGSWTNSGRRSKRGHWSRSWIGRVSRRDWPG